jgi:hypothetical protein
MSDIPFLSPSRNPLIETSSVPVPAPIKPVSFAPSDYSTQGVFQLDDINRLFVKWRKVNGVTYPSPLKPTLFLIGEMEDEHVKAIAFSVSFNPEWVKTATKEEIYRHSSDFFQDEWAAGRLAFFGGIQVRRVKAENHCELI